MRCGLLEVAAFLPHVYLMPSLGVTPLEFRQDLYHHESIIPMLLCGVVCVILL